MNIHGTTIDFPFRADVRGTLKTIASDDDLIRQSIVDLLETRQGERKMIPNYGLPDFVFDVIDVGFAARLAFYIQEQISNYITAVESVAADAGIFDKGKFLPNALAGAHQAAIRVKWLKRNEVVPQELIYPTWRLFAE